MDTLRAASNAQKSRARNNVITSECYGWCGSGHILVEAYDLFKAIYLERGYRQRDIAQLILEKNLFGLDIDQRAAQLTGFALMMKGREDDRRLFERGVKLNVMAMVDSTSLDVDTLVHGIDLSQYGLSEVDLTALKDLFEHATTFGSLIQVPQLLAEKLPALKQLSESNSQDMFVKEVLVHLVPLVKQSEMLAAQYEVVVANPPYIGSKFHSPELKKYAQVYFPAAKSDLFACFIERAILQSSSGGRVGIIAPFVWMFLASYNEFRVRIISETTLTSLIQLEYNAFEPAMVPVATFTLIRKHVSDFTGSYIKLTEFKGHQNQAPRTLQAISDPYCGWLYNSKPDTFNKVPGSPIAYWVPEAVADSFDGVTVGGLCESTGSQNKTANDEQFVRLWHEVNVDDFLLHGKWKGYFKGGSFRKFYGNQQYVVDWSDQARDFYKANKTSNILDERYWFRKGFTYSDVTSGSFSARYMPEGFIYATPGPSFHLENDDDLYALLSLLNSKYVEYVAKILNPTLHFNVGDAKNIPVSSLDKLSRPLSKRGRELVKISKNDWDMYENSWCFKKLHILYFSSEGLLPKALGQLRQRFDSMVSDSLGMERLNNEIISKHYGLGDEFSLVSESDISLRSNLRFRYGCDILDREIESSFLLDTMKELVSYAIGCMMGRYSLDAPGLIYANSGNEGFDASQYTTFPADDDGIIPITDKEWFSDDAANRVEEFISVAWDKSHLEENLAFLTDNLSPKKGEGSRDTLRRYLSDSFFKDHLQTYKKRPIYWLFTSGKLKAFQCLVYLHRYNEGTLARMRTEYVIPLTAKLSSYVTKLESDAEASSSAAEIKKLEKEISQLHKQQAELSSFDERLRHFADQRISLDLDDGVKVNYGKFGDLLAEVKAVTGEKPEVLR